LIQETDWEIIDWIGMHYEILWKPDDWTLGSFIRSHGAFYYAMYSSDFYGWVSVINQSSNSYRVEQVHFDNLSFRDSCRNGWALYSCFRELCSLRKTHGTDAFTFNLLPEEQDLQRFLRAVGARLIGSTWFLKL